MAPRWSDSEIFDLGYSVGMGLTTQTISEVMGKPLGAVSMKMLRLRKRMLNRRDGTVIVPIEVRPEAKRVIDECASFRGQRRDQLIERLMIIIGEEGEEFLENILDDD